MNRLSGTITGIQHHDLFLIVTLAVGSHHFKALILEEHYKIGETVWLIFKESEVLVATKESRVSARNAFLSPITTITTGTLLCEISFAFSGEVISAILTREAIESLGLHEGYEAMWFVKANEVTIQKRSAHES